MKGIENIENEGVLLAVVVRQGTQKEELNFITPNNFPLQVGIHNKQKGAVAKPHKHKPYKKPIIIESQEIFYIESGKLRVDIYDKKDKFFKSTVLNKGDIIILNSGHSVEYLEKTTMVEIKQGPYRGNQNEKEFI